MPKTKPTRELPSNDLILAAIERAICHQGSDRPGESLGSIKQHLGLPHNGWTTLQLRPKLEALEAAGLIEKSRRSSIDLWGLTAKGRRRLGAVRSKLTLPESPQHRRWREARVAANERITEFRNHVRGLLDEARELLEAHPDESAATWFEISDRLHTGSWRLASAIYCLHEWQEPTDSAADIDDAPYRQRGRRHTRGWDRD
jgi:DNA-binding PadR family transcriptional regulator